MTPICLITGFLGTGKTTLLRRIVEQNRERRWVYLVNEFSALDVDGAILSDEDANVVTIPGGSIFCRCLVTEFIGQLTRIHDEMEGIEGVVIEASGIADPQVIADMLKETKLDRHYELAQIVSIVEPHSFLRLVHTLPNITRQVQSADLVLLNKCDLFDEEKLAETEQAVRQIKPEVQLARCVMAEADFPIFGTTESHDRLHGEYALCRDPNYAPFTTEHPDPIDPAALEQFIRENESQVYRVKGHLLTDAGPVYFDYSKAGFRTTPAKPRDRYALAWIVRGDSENLLSTLTLHGLAKLGRN